MGHKITERPLNIDGRWGWGYTDTPAVTRANTNLPVHGKIPQMILKYFTKCQTLQNSCGGV